MNEPDSPPTSEKKQPVPEPPRPAMISKRVTVREDGRYVIFYEFAPVPLAPHEEVPS